MNERQTTLIIHYQNTSFFVHSQEANHFGFVGD
jgi:hypothetical protein